MHVFEIENTEGKTRDPTKDPVTSSYLLQKPPRDRSSAHYWWWVWCLPLCALSQRAAVQKSGFLSCSTYKCSWDPQGFVKGFDRDVNSIFLLYLWAPHLPLQWHALAFMCRYLLTILNSSEPTPTLSHIHPFLPQPPLPFFFSPSFLLFLLHGAGEQHLPLSPTQPKVQGLLVSFG